jgi:hypothetical protein
MTGSIYKIMLRKKPWEAVSPKIQPRIYFETVLGVAFMKGVTLSL